MQNTFGNLTRDSANLHVSLDNLMPESLFAKKICGWLGNSEVNQFLESRLNVPTYGEQLKLMKNWNSNANFLYKGIFVSVNLQKFFVGTIKFGPYDINRSIGELGILIGDTNFWNKGIATISIGLMEKLIKLKFEGIKKVSSSAYEHNSASIRAFLKNGYAIEGIQQNSVKSLIGQSAIIILGKSLD